MTLTLSLLSFNIPEKSYIKRFSSIVGNPISYTANDNFRNRVIIVFRVKLRFTGFRKLPNYSQFSCLTTVI